MSGIPDNLLFFWHDGCMTVRREHASGGARRTPARVPAADQTLRILTFLTTQRAPVPASVIAASLDLPRSTVYHLLAELAAHGYVTHLPAERRWGLGTAAFELGGGYARQEPLARLGRAAIAHLADRVGENAHLAVMSGRDVLYIVEERAPRRVALVSDVGVRLPAHLTASGRAMLAAMPREQVRAVYPDASVFADRTGTGPRSPAQLREVLRLTRGRGYAQEESEITVGLRSVGVAVSDHTGWPVAAVAITWETARDSDGAMTAAHAGAAEDTAKSLAAALYGSAARST